MHSARVRILILTFTAALVALCATGCRTTEGLGKDVENLGDKIQEKASK